MELKEAHDFIIQSDEEGLITYVNQNRQELKMLFMSVFPDKGVTHLLSQILVYLSTLHLSESATQSDEIQFLYTNLAFYFKSANRLGYVNNCINQLSESILKNRLYAWLHYKQYTNRGSHIKLFPNYLRKISSAISDGIENYENDVYRDIHDYFLYGTELLEKHKETELLNQFTIQFSNESLQAEYPILRLYNENIYQFTIGVSINSSSDKIFEPSVFTERLFNDKFINYLKFHADTKWYEVLLGFDSYTIRSQIINFGQANFDKGYRGLSASDVVKLYSYFNMRKHYYSSVYLMERFNPIKQFYSSNGILKFIDIGCGPATSGIALIDFLNRITNTKIAFDYFGVDYYQSMRTEAGIMMNNNLYRPVEHEKYIESLDNFDSDWLNNANSIFINTCYLFASPSLNETELANSIKKIRLSKPNVPCFLLFQNTTDPSKNIRYFNFKKKLGNPEVLLTENYTIQYNNRRNSYYKPTPEPVFFEILKL